MRCRCATVRTRVVKIDKAQRRICAGYERKNRAKICYPKCFFHFDVPLQPVVER